MYEMDSKTSFKLAVVANTWNPSALEDETGDHAFETGIFDRWDCPKSQGPTMMQNFKTSADRVHSLCVIFSTCRYLEIWRNWGKKVLTM